MSKLEDTLAQVKSLYQTKYGEDVDDDEEEDEMTKYVEKDGITWAVTRGSTPQVSKLEDTLAEVKSLYKTKYGEDVDDADEEDEETYAWIVSRGSPPTMSTLEDMLDEVKSLYETKYGEDMDDDDEEDGWIIVEA